MASDNSVIGSPFCLNRPLELVIVRKIKALGSGGNFLITDADGNLLFKAKQPLTCFGSSKIVLYDSSGAPVVTLRNKVFSWHSRWQVFRGDGTEPGSLVFSVKRSSLWQLKTKLSVFLANNRDEVNADFKVKGSYWERSCAVLSGGSGQVLAQMHKEESLKSVFLGKDKFMVRVNPNVDYAFIAVLIVILDAINRAARSSSSGGGDGGGGGGGDGGGGGGGD